MVAGTYRRVPDQSDHKSGCSIQKLIKINAQKIINYIEKKVVIIWWTCSSEHISGLSGRVSMDEISWMYFVGGVVGLGLGGITSLASGGSSLTFVSLGSRGGGGGGGSWRCLVTVKRVVVGFAWPNTRSMSYTLDLFINFYARVRIYSRITHKVYHNFV